MFGLTTGSVQAGGGQVLAPPEPPHAVRVAWHGDSGQDPGLSPVERGLLALTNDYRARLGLPRLRADPGLQALARAASERMAQLRLASHDGFQARFRHSGAYLCVENIVRGRFTPEVAMALWRRSPEHHRNLLEPRARYVGVAEVGGYATLFACDLPGR